MCVGQYSLRHCASAPELKDLPAADVEYACRTWEMWIWPALDHTRMYCINPKTLTLAILHEKTLPVVYERYRRRRFKSVYKETHLTAMLTYMFAQSPASSWGQKK